MSSNVVSIDVPNSLNVDESFTVLWTLYQTDRETLVTVAPDTVKLRIVAPNGTATEYTYGVDNEVQQITNPYLYRCNVIFDAPGLWSWKFMAQWTSDPLTAGNIIVEGQVKVRSNAAQGFA